MIRMTRRELIRGLGAGALAALGAPLLPACSRGTLAARGGAPVGPPLGPGEERVLAHAALAPSGHNAQPWAVRLVGRRRWTVSVDPARRLAAVDPADREAVLSLGAFVELLAAAAAAEGLAAEVEGVAAARGAADLVSIRLEPARAGAGAQADLERIRRRRTLRKGYRGDALRREDLAALLGAAGPAAAWFAAGSREAAWLADAEVEAFRRQTWRDDAQAELAAWFRLSDGEVALHRDGLSLATAEAGALAALYLAHLAGRGAVMQRRFREGGIEQVVQQARAGAGWLVVSAPDETTGALLDAGRRFARTALRLRERGIGMHPMTQVLEEEPWRSRVAGELGLPGIPQFTLRVGYVTAYPEPVSPRRAPAAFARSA